MKPLSLHQNLESARLVVLALLAYQYDIAFSIWDLLDYGDEDEQRLLPGDAMEEIMDRWKKVLFLASEPVSMQTKGRDKVRQIRQQQDARETIRLVASEAIAVLEIATKN